MIKIEVCANSVESAVIAQKAGANRIELCNNLKEGGTTPPLSQIRMARKELHIELNVLIRPRGGDFIYNEMEFELMKEDIHTCGKEGCNGVVIGMLKKDGNIDKERTAQLIQIAQSYGMTTTFHRAFDRAKSLYGALEDIITLGCHKILTSGGKNTAIEGKMVLKELIEQANKRIIILAGAGIKAENIQELIQHTNLTEFHGTFKSPKTSKMEYKNPDMEAEQEVEIADMEEIKRAIVNAKYLN